MPLQRSMEAPTRKVREGLRALLSRRNSRVGMRSNMRSWLKQFEALLNNGNKNHKYAYHLKDVFP
jgi:hypothetical protein